MMGAGAGASPSADKALVRSAEASAKPGADKNAETTVAPHTTSGELCAAVLAMVSPATAPIRCCRPVCRCAQASVMCVGGAALEVGHQTVVERHAA